MDPSAFSPDSLEECRNVSILGHVSDAPRKPVYAAPRTITSLTDCYFYHTTDVPGFGHIDGEWDLRGGR